MKYMLIMRATDEAIEQARQMPFEDMLEAMGRYNESLMEAGVMVGGEGLSESSEGAVIDFATTPPTVTEGAYGETKELFDGFWIIETETKEQAIEWASRCPLGPGSKLELRRVQDSSDFDPDNERVKKEEAWRVELAERAAKR